MNHRSNRAMIAAGVMISGCYSNGAILCNEAAGVPLEPGPECQCDSLFPMCAGAYWRFQVEDDNSTPEPDKAWSIMGVARNISLTFDSGKEVFTRVLPEAWSFCRTDRYSARQAWLTKEDDRIYWENSVWFAPDGSGREDTWYEPRRVRTFLQPEDLPSSDTYDEYEVLAGDDTVVTPLEVAVDWSEMATPRNVAQRFAASDVSCQQSFTWWPTDDPKGEDAQGDTSSPEDTKYDSSKTASFCFVRGVGKVWEYTIGEAIENLTDWNVPGCD